MKKYLTAVIACCTLAMCTPAPALAKGFGSSRSSYTSSSKSYFRTPAAPRYAAPATPKPTPAPVQNVTVNRTTVVQQNAVQQSGGGGFFSSFAGSFAGAGIASWLFAPKPAAQPQQVIDCAKQPLPVEWAQHCPPAK